MMAFFTLFWLIPITFIFFLSIPYQLSMISPMRSADAPTKALINRICQQTADFDFCNRIFNDNLYTNSTDIKGLTQIALTQTLIFATDTERFIRTLEADEKDKSIRDLYKVCEQGYDLVIDHFVNANLEFANGDYRSMVVEVEKCNNFMNDCQSGLDSKVPAMGVKNLEAGVLIRMAQISGELIGQVGDFISSMPLS